MTNLAEFTSVLGCRAAPGTDLQSVKEARVHQGRAAGNSSVEQEETSSRTGSVWRNLLLGANSKISFSSGHTEVIVNYYPQKSHKLWKSFRPPPPAFPYHSVPPLRVLLRTQGSNPQLQTTNWLFLSAAFCFLFRVNLQSTVSLPTVWLEALTLLLSVYVIYSFLLYLLLKGEEAALRKEKTKLFLFPCNLLSNLSVRDEINIQSWASITPNLPVSVWRRSLGLKQFPAANLSTDGARRPLWRFLFFTSER